MSIFVKICGLARAQDVTDVAALCPDALGFIFYENSPRAVTAEQVREWTQGVPKSIKRVGVFVNETPETILRTQAVAGLDIIQFHGGESAETMSACTGGIESTGSTWAAVHLDKCSAATAKKLPVDALLIDSYNEQLPGGTGKTVNWELAADFRQACSLPIILAGGLTPQNVATAIRKVFPWAVDVSSGTEASPGIKDISLVDQFIQESRSA